MTTSPFRLEGRVALVTGGGGHLGGAISAALAEAGATVLINGRDRARLDAVAASLAARGLRAEVWPFDVTDARAVEQAFAAIAERHGRLDLLVNNASSGAPGTVDTVGAADFEQSWRIAVMAAFECVRAARPLLRAAAAAVGHASVVNVATMYAAVSPDPRIYGDSKLNSPPNYGAAKAGLVQLTRYLACHLAAEKIRVNVLTPGPFPPRAAMAARPEFAERLCDKVPMGRLGEPHEVAGPVVFLASDAASYVTGATLPVDGGWQAW